MEHLNINQNELKNYKLGNLPPYQYIPNPVANHQQDWTITRVSVIIPAFNAFDTLPQTLMSIAMQENIHEIETLIIDDCSTEGTYDEIAFGRKPLYTLEYRANEEPRNRTLRHRLGVIQELQDRTGEVPAGLLPL